MYETVIYPQINYVGIAPTDEAQRYEILDLIGEKYVLCPGLKRSFYEDKVGVTGYHRENVRVLSFPFLRYESTKCLLWHQPCNKYTRYGHDLHNVCQECKKEAQRALANAERCVLVSPEEKDARRDPTSKYPVSKLSPASASEKVKRLKKDRKNFREKIQRLTEVSSKFTLLWCACYLGLVYLLRCSA